jgi:hypothetical protein
MSTEQTPILKKTERKTYEEKLCFKFLRKNFR